MGGSTAAVENVKTMNEVREESVASRTFAMHLLVGFSLVATLLALVGLYGVLSLSVGSRLREMAVRKAIGAQRTQIVSLVLAEGARLIVVGVGWGSRWRSQSGECSAACCSASSPPIP